MQNDILFDNIYIGHSIDDAETFGNSTFTIKKETEKAVEEAEAPKPTDPKADTPKSTSDLSFMEDPVTFFKEKVTLFTETAKRNPMEAITTVPEISAPLGIGLITFLLVLLGGIGGGAAAAAPSKEQIQAKAQAAQKKAQETKDQVADAVASGTERVKDEVNKRSTRSSAE